MVNKTVLKMNSLKKIVFTVSLFVLFGYLEAACPTNYKIIGSTCLQAFDSVEATWEEAKTACEDNGGHLAYFNDCTLMRIISNYLGSTNPSANKYWVGASKEEDTWVWLDGSSVQMGAPFWGSSTPGWIEEPNGAASNTDYCAVLDNDDQYHLHDETCSSTLNYLCEADTLLLSETKNEEPSKLLKRGTQFTECPNDFILISGSCYYFNTNTKTTYSEGQSICNDLDARLAVFSDCTLYGEVVSYINDNADVQLPATASYWIGANDEGTEGEWYWEGPYTELATGLPFWGSSNGVAEPNGDTNQNCAVLYRDNQYYFHDGECYKLAYPLCELLE